jgi:hypothetical protein
MTQPRPSSARTAWAALAAVAAGIVASIITTLIATRTAPAIRFEMDHDHRAAVSGLYPSERVESRTFAWSGPTLAMALPGADRSVAWACDAGVINWRPPSAGQARVVVASRGTTLLDTTVTSPEAALRFTVPPAEGYGLDVRIDISPAFRPGGADTRALGLAFDWIRCAPAAGVAPRPPTARLVTGAAAAVSLGVMSAIVGLPAGVGALVTSIGAVLLAVAAGIGLAPYLSGTPPVAHVAGLVALLFSVPFAVADRLTARRATMWARLAVVVSAVACAVKIVFVLHPDKPLVDALFHAHRFDAVLAGHFYFTQLSTSATPFPYAIGLYVFAAPFAWLTADHVLLLRVVVYVAEAAAALLVYTMVARWWDSGGAGVVAVLLLHLMPLPFFVIGNANLTNAFGQSASLAVIGAATLWNTAPRRLAVLAALTALCTLAFVSHVSIVVILGLTLAVLVGVRWVMPGPSDRPAVRGLVIAVALGAVLAVVLYWGHFGDLYAAQLRRTVATDTRPAPARPAATGQDAPFRYDGLDLVRQAGRDAGWPIAVLATAGAAWLVRTRRRDRLAALVTAQLLVWAAILAVGTLAPIKSGMHQDVWEFAGRVTLATSPSLAMLAAAGAAWAWRSGVVFRALAGATVAAAVWPAADALRTWFVR